MSIFYHFRSALALTLCVVACAPPAALQGSSRDAPRAAKGVLRTAFRERFPDDSFPRVRELFSEPEMDDIVHLCVRQLAMHQTCNTGKAIRYIRFRNWNWARPDSGSVELIRMDMPHLATSLGSMVTTWCVWNERGVWKAYFTGQVAFAEFGAIAAHDGTARGD